MWCSYFWGNQSLLLLKWISFGNEARAFYKKPVSTNSGSVKVVAVKQKQKRGKKNASWTVILVIFCIILIRFTMHLQIQQQPIWDKLGAEKRQINIFPRHDHHSFLWKKFNCLFNVVIAGQSKPFVHNLSISFTFSFVTAHWAHSNVHYWVLEVSLGLHSLRQP